MAHNMHFYKALEHLQTLGSQGPGTNGADTKDQWCPLCQLNDEFFQNVLTTINILSYEQPYYSMLSIFLPTAHTKWVYSKQCFNYN